MGTMVLSNANNFHCSAMQYSCCAKPLLEMENSLITIFFDNMVVAIKQRKVELFGIRVQHSSIWLLS